MRLVATLAIIGFLLAYCNAAAGQMERWGRRSQTRGGYDTWGQTRPQPAPVNYVLNTQDTSSKIRPQIATSFQNLVDLSRLSYENISRKLQTSGWRIAADSMGYFRDVTFVYRENPKCSIRIFISKSEGITLKYKSPFNTDADKTLHNEAIAEMGKIPKGTKRTTEWIQLIHNPGKAAIIVTHNDYETIYDIAYLIN